MVAGLSSGLAGCNVLSGGEESTPTPTSTPTDPTPEPEVQSAFETARSELTAAFGAIHSMELYRGDRLVADPQKFESYDSEEALSHVSAAREAISTAQGKVGDNDEAEVRVDLLKNVALVAETGAKSYEEFSIAFIGAWFYEKYAHLGALRKAVEQIGLARQALSNVPKHRSDLENGLTSIENASLSQQVDGFDLQTWANINASLKAEVRALSPIFQGFEAHIESVLFDFEGRKAMKNDDAEKAYSTFSSAIEKAGESKRALSIAQDRDTSFFNDRVMVYYCVIPKWEDAYVIHREAAAALGQGDEQRAKDLHEKGNTKYQEAVETCKSG